jgi:hypothetical protein
MHDVITKITWMLAVIPSMLLRSHAQLVSENQCATGVHAIIARGQGGGDDLNVMSTLSDLILQQIPGSTTLGLPYDHVNVLTDEAKRDTVHDGAVLMQEFVQEYAQSCPESNIVVVGYSMVCPRSIPHAMLAWNGTVARQWLKFLTIKGAIVMMDALCGTSEVGFIFVAPLQPIYSKTST